MAVGIFVGFGVLVAVGVLVGFGVLVGLGVFVGVPSLTGVDGAEPLLGSATSHTPCRLGKTTLRARSSE